jgi:hypothetical protein
MEQESKRSLFWSVSRGPIQTSLRAVIGTRAPQKTFDCFRRGDGETPHVKVAKVFYGAFFQKNDRFLEVC